MPQLSARREERRVAGVGCAAHALRDGYTDYTDAPEHFRHALRFPGSRYRKNPLMRSLVVAMTVMTLVPAAPAAGPAPVQVQAGVDVRSGGSRSSAPVIDSDGRGERARDRANCRTVKLTEWRDGAKVSRRERRCER